jgi:hypothetical protein
MRLSRILPLLLLVSSVAPIAAHAEPVENDGVSVTVEDRSITFSNGLLSRRFNTSGLQTLDITAFGEVRSTRAQDVAITAEETSADALLDSRCVENPETICLLPVSVDVAPIPGGLALTRTIGTSGFQITRRDEMVAGISGMRSQTSIVSLAPVVLEGYQPERLRTGIGNRATVHAFRAGADWRYDEGFDPVGIGDDHRGQWRSTTQGATGQDVYAFGEWLEVAYPDGASAAVVMERNDYASSRGEFHGPTGTARSTIDLSRDIVYAGPFEEQIHVESTEVASETGRGTTVGRVRAIGPGTWSMEPVYTVFGRDSDEAAAQFQALLARQNRDFERRVIFNTNNVDSNRISTGAKDDADFATVVDLAAKARAAGIDTLVLDDGWQAISGDWCPDSPECPEPRKASNPTKFAARFPDPTFSAVRDVLAGEPGPEDDLDLGLWMTPMEFHPSSTAFKTNPQWACLPVGVGTAAVSIAQPDSSSNEAGIGVWNPLAMGVNPEDPTQPMRLDHWIESRIDRMVDVFGARYFKFDFLAFIDCGGVQPVDQYQYREAFIAMVDRLIAKHPHVLFTIDETNDYRMFPYESTSRGATWFQNGSPNVDQTLHNIWNLSPYVPGYTLGQGIASRGDEIASLGIDRLMAAGLTSHMTVWRDLRSYSAAQLAQMKVWNDFYRANAASLATMTYPLLEDPLEKEWTALQPWDAATSSGWVLAYRQGDLRPSVGVPLKALGQLPGEMVFDVTAVDPATGSSSATTMTAAELSGGDLVAAAATNGYAFFRITPAAEEPCNGLPSTGC